MTPQDTADAPLADVVQEHADEAMFLWFQRAHAVHAPNYSPKQFADLDERLAAHLDGLRVAGDAGWDIACAALVNRCPEDYFPSAVLALETPDTRFDQLVERATKQSDVVPGLISALGWVSSRYLAGRAMGWFDDPLPLRQKLGLAACALHRLDPGAALVRALNASADSVRIRALRSAGELGRIDTLAHCRAQLFDPKPEAAFWAARSAVLLGDRGDALAVLRRAALAPGARRLRAMQLLLQTLDPADAHAFLLELAATPDAARLRVIGAGWSGNPRYAAWLVEQMANPALARIAAEAFVNIAGPNFNIEQMEAPPPDGFEDGPSDDPDDEQVDVPEDVALPWPDAARIASWWSAQQGRFEAGRRYFLGKPATPAHCRDVLATGFQRQRIAAALFLPILAPGSVLFNCSAPAWRQTRLLGGASS